MKVSLTEDASEALPKVSVSIITYNQEDYIGEAIEGALKQITNFKFEIVIGDDNSTDATREICLNFKSKHPDKIRLIEREKNLGAVRNYLDTYSACYGKYVAFCEGDDFWIDPEKLQKQVDFLDANPDYAICFHNVRVTDKSGALGKPLFETLPDTSTINDLCQGDYISTPSCMVRNHQVKAIPGWIYELPGCDWPFDILNAECGKIKCIPGLMAAYRRHDASIWSSVEATQQSLIAIDMTTKLNRHLGGRYQKDFDINLAKNRASLDFYAHKQAAPENKSYLLRLKRLFPLIRKGSQ